MLPTINKKQRCSIVALISIIIVFQIGFILINKRLSVNQIGLSAEEKHYQFLIDSQLRLTTNKLILKPFNPNFITDYKGYLLSMTINQLDKLFMFRKTNKYVNSTKEFQKITGVSDSLLNKFSHLFVFPDWVKNQKNTLIKIDKIDVNKATEQDFKKIKGIGNVYAKRIVKYRTSLNGFSDKVQLYQVYGLDTVLVKKIINTFSFRNLKVIVKKNINEVSLADLIKCACVKKEIAEKILIIRSKKGNINSFNQLAEVMNERSLNRIKIYFFIEKGN